MYLHGTPFVRIGTRSKKAEDKNRFIENEIDQTKDGRYVWTFDVEEGEHVNKALLIQHEFFQAGGSKEEVLGGLPFSKKDRQGLDRLLPALAEEVAKLKEEYETFGKIDSKAFAAEEGLLNDPKFIKRLAIGGGLGVFFIILALAVNAVGSRY